MSENFGLQLCLQFLILDVDRPLVEYIDDLLRCLFEVYVDLAESRWFCGCPGHRLLETLRRQLLIGTPLW